MIKSTIEKKEDLNELLQMKNRVSSFLATHQSFVLLLLAFVVFRFLSIVLLRPGGFVTDSGPDQFYYFAFSRFTGSGQVPFFDFWMEYPPLMPWLATLAYKASLYLPIWENAIFWFNLFFRLLLLPFDIGILTLIYLCVLRFGNVTQALQAASLWALLFAPLITLLSWFDPLTLFFLMLGIYGLLYDRPLLAGAAIGLGLMAKVLPIAIAPLGLLSLKGVRQRIVYTTSAFTFALLVILPPLIVAPKYVIAWVSALTNVSSWETVWALLEGYYSYGIVASLYERHDPTASVFSANSTQTVPWFPITVAFLAIYVYLITRDIDWENKRKVALFALFSVTIFILYSKGYSPQWATYLSTLSLLALSTGRGLGYGLLLGILLVIEWPFAFVVLKDHDWFLAAVVVLRTFVILCLSLDAVSRVLPDSRVQKAIRRGAFPGALLLFITATVILAQPAWNAYGQNRLREEVMAPFIEFQMATEDGPDSMILLQPSMLERLHPYLIGTDIHLVPEASIVTEWLERVLPPNESAWFIYDNGSDYRPNIYDEAATWFEEQTCLVQHVWYGPVEAIQYVRAPFSKEQDVLVLFGDSLSLQTATLPQKSLSAGESFCLRLTWLVEGLPQSDYAIFVHLIASDGHLIAQSDIWPAVPTASLSIGDVMITEHGVVLPKSLEPGVYAIHTGLYALSNGERVPLSDGRDYLFLGTLMVE